MEAQYRKGLLPANAVSARPRGTDQFHEVSASGKWTIESTAPEATARVLNLPVHNSVILSHFSFFKATAQQTTLSSWRAA